MLISIEENTNLAYASSFHVIHYTTKNTISFSVPIGLQGRVCGINLLLAEIVGETRPYIGRWYSSGRVCETNLLLAEIVGETRPYVGRWSPIAVPANQRCKITITAAKGIINTGIISKLVREAIQPTTLGKLAAPKLATLDTKPIAAGINAEDIRCGNKAIVAG